MQSARPVVRVVIAAWLAVVLAATAVEAAIGLRWLDIGPAPGQDPAIRDLLAPLVLAALFGGSAALGLASLAGDGTVQRFGALPELGAVPLVAAAYLVALTRSYDSHYAPALRRVATNIPTGAVVTMAVVAIACAATLRVRALRRPALLASGVLLFAVVFTMMAGGGH